MHISFANEVALTVLLMAHIVRNKRETRRRSYPYRVTDENDDDDYDGMQERHASSSSSSSHRYRILSLIETFIDQIFHIRKTLLGVSISAVIVAPIAIGLSVYLLRHPSFLAILDIENDFGTVLGILLGAIIIISSIWLVVGIRQYRLIGSWNKRYGNYIREKQEIDRIIGSQYGEDTTSDTNTGTDNDSRDVTPLS
jgi:hypothetical protein